MGIANLPGSWSSTANALETSAHTTKDVLMAVDDYVPEPGSQQKADRLFRAQGNGRGRGRLTAGGAKSQSSRFPRGLILSTGEDVPGGQSLRARIVVTEIGKNSISQERLTLCQADACSGLYVRALGGYVRWLAPQYGDVNKSRDTDIAELRPLFDHPGQHRRTATNLASLMYGLEHLLEYATEIGAISPAEKSQLRERFVNALKIVAVNQTEHQGVESEVQKFVRLLSAAFEMGRVHLRGLNNAQPRNGTRWGWLAQFGKHNHGNMVPRGTRIGWIDEDKDKEKSLLLLPDAAYRAAQEIAATSQDQIKVGPRTLWKLLEEDGMLMATEAGIHRGRTVRMCVRGTRMTVLHLLVDRFLGAADEDPEPPSSPPGDQPTNMAAAETVSPSQTVTSTATTPSPTEQNQVVFVDGSFGPKESWGRKYVRSPKETESLMAVNIILLDADGTYTVLERSRGTTKADPSELRIGNRYKKMAGDKSYNGKVRMMDQNGKRLTAVRGGGVTTDVDVFTPGEVAAEEASSTSGDERG